eukprot:885861-Lingulodinium_polyedra.AAC.1
MAVAFCVCGGPTAGGGRSVWVVVTFEAFAFSFWRGPDAVNVAWSTGSPSSNVFTERHSSSTSSW